MDPSEATPDQATPQTDMVAQPEREARPNAREYESPSGSSISSGDTSQDSKDLCAEEISLGSVQFQPILDDPERLLNLKVTLTMLHQGRCGHEHCRQQIERLKAENRALKLRISDLEQPSCAPDGGERIDRQTSSILTSEDAMNFNASANAPRSSSWPLVPRANDNVGPQKTTRFPRGMAPSLAGAVSEASTLEDEILCDASLLQRNRPDRFPPSGADSLYTMQRPKIYNASFSSSPSIKYDPGLTETIGSTDELYNTGGQRSRPRDEDDDAGERKRRRFKYDLKKAQHGSGANDVKAANNAQGVFDTYDGRCLDRYYSSGITIPQESFGDVCTLIDGCKFIKAFGFIELRWVAPDNSCSSLKLRFPSKEVNINALYAPNKVNSHKRRDLNMCLKKGKNFYESPWYWIPINWAKTLMRVDYFGPFLDKRSHVIIDMMAKIAEMCDNAGLPLDQAQSAPG